MHRGSSAEPKPVLSQSREVWIASGIDLLTFIQQSNSAELIKDDEDDRRCVPNVNFCKFVIPLWGEDLVKRE